MSSQQRRRENRTTKRRLKRQRARSQKNRSKTNKQQGGNVNNSKDTKQARKAQERQQNQPKSRGKGVEQHRQAPNRTSGQMGVSTLPYGEQIKIASLNMRGSKIRGKREEVEQWMQKQNIDVLAIQETHANMNAREKEENTAGTSVEKTTSKTTTTAQQAWDL